MSNKKRIQKKVRSIEYDQYVKKFRLGCEILGMAITNAVQMKLLQKIKSNKIYPSGGYIPNNDEPEVIRTSDGKGKVLPLFKFTDVNGNKWLALGK